MTAFYMFRLMAMTFLGGLSRSGVGGGARWRTTPRTMPMVGMADTMRMMRTAPTALTMPAGMATARGTGRTNRRRR